MTDYLRPADLGHALAARAEHPDWWLLAGGTDLMVGQRAAPRGVIDLFGLPELRGVRREGDRVWIGAATTYAELIRSDLVRELLPCLHACAREVGALQIQERGTIGGNVATSSPVGDTLPVLLALDAEVELASASARRTLAYHGFCTGYRQTALTADELIVGLSIPTPAPGTRQFWRKVGTRRAQAISKVMVAAAARLGPGREVVHARLAMGAVAALPLRLEGVEELLRGEVPGPELARRARAAVEEAITPITDVRSTAPYRSAAAGNLAARFVLELAEDAA